ncbi:ATPase family gene 2 protein homolog A-like [Lineus longissimus]|uniref:ATPase family gene 2 protein homolog A-like n=1 Tax=Lineus longissimus TaxID=88925 RepID=UPI002B4F9D00
MPPKSKCASRTDCQQCKTCSCVIGVRDLKKHANLCKNDSGADSFSEESEEVGLSLGSTSGSRKTPDVSQLLLEEQHGFVKGRTVFAVVETLENDAHLPKSSKDSLITLSPAAMRLCNISIGCPIVVNDKQVCYAWPCNSIAFASASIPTTCMAKLGIAQGTVVKIETLTGSKIIANTLTIYPVCNKTFILSKCFVDFIRGKFHGRYFTAGNVLSGKYLGQTYKLIIAKIVGCDGSVVGVKSEELAADISAENRSAQTTDIPSIVADMSSLSLNESRQETSSDILFASTPKPCSRNMQTSEQTPEEDVIKKDLSFGLNDSVLNRNFSTPKKALQMSSDKRQLFYTLENRTVLNITTHLDDEDLGRKGQPMAKVNVEMIGGLDKELEAIMEVISLPLDQPGLFQAHGLPAPKGVLLYGPTGTGKSLIIRAVANQAKAHVISVKGPEIWSKFYGESEAKLRAIFQEATERAPSLIVIDELDAMCPKRDSVQSEAEKRVVATLLTLMDGLDMSHTRHHVLVLAATNKPDALDPALRRPGRFDREIEIPVPSVKQRKEILQKLLLPLHTSVSEEDIARMAENAHGFVGADLAAVCKEAGLRAVKREIAQASEAFTVEKDDFLYALKAVQPSAMREVAIDVPKVLWTDIGGQANLKLKLKQAVEWPLKHPEAFERMGIQPPKGLLMYGPPGCSKTMIAKALATESGLNFIAIKGPELFSKWVGESEKAVREVFRKARSAAPSIVFFDEIDALAVERGSGSGSHNVADRVLAQLLTEMDGIEKLKDVTIIAATNRPDMIDKALMRPGRIDRIVYVPLPDEETRRDIFRIKFRDMPVDDGVDLEELVVKTEGYSGAEVTAVCHEAALFTLQDDINAIAIKSEHFHQALAAVSPRTSPQMMAFYQDYQSKFGLKAV